MQQVVPPVYNNFLKDHSSLGGYNNFILIILFLIDKTHFLYVPYLVWTNVEATLMI